MPHWQATILAAALVALVGCGGSATAPRGDQGASGSASAQAGPPAAAGIVADPTPWPAGAPRMSLRLGLNTVSASMAPLWVAKEAGIFDEYGFDVEFITLQSSAQVAKVMASGEVPIAISAAAGVVDAALAGDDQVLISGFQNYMNFWAYARPDVHSVAELRGKRMGTTRFGSGAHLAAMETVRRNGLEPERDVAILQIGAQSEVWGALVAGAVDAAILSIPFNLQAQSAGMPLIYDVSAQRIPYLQNGLATSRSYLSRNEDVVQRAMMAHLAGLARVQLDKSLTVDVLGRYLRSDDRELMSRTYDTIAPLFERLPYPTAASIQTVIDQRAAENPAAANLTPAQVSDERYVRELEQSGFADRVYGASAGQPARRP